MTDWELGVQATAKVAKKYLEAKWGDQESISMEKAIDYLDMEAFDNWAQEISEDEFHEFLEQYMPEKYSGSIPPEPTAEEQKRYTPDYKEHEDQIMNQSPPKIKDPNMPDDQPLYDDTYMTPEEELWDDSRVHQEAPQDDPEANHEYLDSLKRQGDKDSKWETDM